MPKPITIRVSREIALVVSLRRVGSIPQYWFSVGPGNCSACPLACPAECVQSHQFVDVGYDCAGADCLVTNAAAASINISISAMSEIGTHGFAVLLYNAISSVKFEPGSSSSDWGAMTPAYEDIQG